MSDRGLIHIRMHDASGAVYASYSFTLRNGEDEQQLIKDGVKVLMSQITPDLGDTIRFVHDEWDGEEPELTDNALILHRCFSRKKWMVVS